MRVQFVIASFIPVIVPFPLPSVILAKKSITPPASTSGSRREGRVRAQCVVPSSECTCLNQNQGTMLDVILMEHPRSLAKLSVSSKDLHSLLSK